MAVQYEKYKPYLVRVPTINDVSEKIQRFGVDNLYPQKAEMLVKRSLTLRGVLDRIADFINGEGFLDQNIAKLIVNKKGLEGSTLNKVLTQVSKSYSAFDTVCLHIGYNLNYQISSITPVPFSYVRFGLKDKEGKVCKLAYSANWEKDGRKGMDDKIVFYPVFNPDPLQVEKEIIECGGIQNYKGQIVFLTPEDGQYPLATFDAVFDDAQTQSELSVLKVSNVQNSFLSTLAIVYPGEFGSDQERQDFNDLIANKVGPSNAGSRIGIQDKTGTKKASDIFQSLSPTNLDKLFELTEKTIKENIIENYAFPKILLGITPDGLFAQANLEEAYTYANSITRNRRAYLSEVFSMLLKYWETPIETDAKIIEQRYVVEGISGGDAFEVNDNLKNMTGMQAVNFARILRKYQQKKYTRDVAQTMLRGGFGLSEDEITKLLDGIDTAATEEEGLTDTKVAAFTKDALMLKMKDSELLALIK